MNTFLSAYLLSSFVLLSIAVAQDSRPISGDSTGIYSIHRVPKDVVQRLIPKGTELEQIKGLAADQHLITMMQLKHDYVVSKIAPFMKVSYSAIYISVPNLKIKGHSSKTVFTSNLRDYTNSLRSYFLGLPYAYPKKVVDIKYDGVTSFNSKFVTSNFETDTTVNVRIFHQQLPQLLSFFTQPFLQVFPSGKFICADFAYQTRSEIFAPVSGGVNINSLSLSKEPPELLGHYPYRWQEDDLNGRATRVSGTWKLTSPKSCYRYP